MFLARCRALGQRRHAPTIRWFVAVTWFLALLPSAALFAADLQVTTHVDTLTGPDCSLRAALRASDLDVAVGGCPAGSPGLDRVWVPAGIFDLSPQEGGDDPAEVGDLDVLGPVDVMGAGRELTILRGPGSAGMASDRVIEILEGGAVSLSDLSIQGGQAELGGGILVGRSGQLALVDCEILGNRAAVGGGVHLDRATASIDRCELRDNVAGEGGGVYQFASDLVVRRSRWVSNRAEPSSAGPMGGGGAMAGAGGTMRIETSDMTGNRADDTRWGGGGVLVIGGELTVSRSTLSDNSATDSLGDGSLVDPMRDESGGGAIAAWNATVRVENATFSSNRANDSRWGGGGMLSIGTDLRVSHATFWGNSADGGGVALPGLVIGGSLSDLVPGDVGFDFAVVVGSSIVSSGSPAECFSGVVSMPGTVTQSAIDDASCSSLASSIGPVSGLDPTLQDHGGLTRTHLLLPGSNAIDAGNSVCSAASMSPLLIDQRGLPRPSNGLCDLGAIEIGPEGLFSDRFQLVSHWASSSQRTTPITANWDRHSMVIRKRQFERR